MKLISSALAVAGVSLLLSSPVHAQNHGGGARGACKQDVQSFCSDVQPGGGRIIQCLKSHSDQLSDGCASALEKLRDRKKGGGDDSSSSQGGSDDKAPQDNGSGDSDSSN